MTVRFQASTIPRAAFGSTCGFRDLHWGQNAVQGDFSSSTREERIRQVPFHPCMHEQAHHQIARLHLPVAAKCNIRCGYCEREVSSRAAFVVAPGVSASVLSPRQALAKARDFLDYWGNSAVVGIAGPGEPLANEQTLETLSLIRREYPQITLCLCTNGLNLPDQCEDLRMLGVRYLTVTINGFDPSVVAQIQSTVNKAGLVYEGEHAAQVLIQSQMKGLMRAVEVGMIVKVNYVVIPEINGTHVTSTAQRVRDLGARVFNPIPLIPRGLFRNMNKPDDRYMIRLRAQCGTIMPVFGQCKQCRADAEGIPGKERAR